MGSCVHEPIEFNTAMFIFVNKLRIMDMNAVYFASLCRIPKCVGSQKIFQILGRVGDG